MTGQKASRVAIELHAGASSATAAMLQAPDVYFTKGYGAAEEANGAGQWVTLVAFDGLWQLPLHLRDSSLGRDAVSPYGYAGVYASVELAERDMQAAWAETENVLLDLGVLSVFLRQSPLMPPSFTPPSAELILSGHPTILLDTRRGDLAWKAMEGRSRTSIRKAERSGFRTAVRPATLEDLAGSSAFRTMYETGMRRREASPRYFFNDAYYERLHTALGTNLLIAQTEDQSGQIVAAALFMRHGELLHYHLSGSEWEAGRAGATNQLIWQAVLWAADNGVKSLHLGGGVTANDALCRFKRSFGGQVLRFDAIGLVVDGGGYLSAVDARSKQSQISPEELARSNYFPLFRASA